LKEETKHQDREEYKKDALYPFYDFINALVSKQLNNKEANGSVKKFLPFSIENLKIYTKSNWLIIFAYHYLINSKDSNHCK